MKIRLIPAALAAAVLLGACASAPEPLPALERARAVVRQAEQNPIVLANAPLDLKKAGDALARADAMRLKGASIADVSSAAYVAERAAQTAVALAEAKRDEDAIGAAQAERERARADAQTARARNAQLRADAALSQAAAAQQQTEAARQQAAIAQNRANAAQAQAAQARSEADMAREAAARTQAENAALVQQMQDLQARQTDRGTVVTLGDVLFEFNRADVKPGAQGALRKLAEFLVKHPDRSVLIEGHTDSVGSAAYNEALSQRRAEAVRRELGALGVAPERIQAVGYGESFPLAENNTETNRALNRRVEVYIGSDAQPVRRRG